MFQIGNEDTNALIVFLAPYRDLPCFLAKGVLFQLCIASFKIICMCNHIKKVMKLCPFYTNQNIFRSSMINVVIARLKITSLVTCLNLLIWKNQPKTNSRKEREQTINDPQINLDFIECLWQSIIMKLAFQPIKLTHSLNLNC